LKFLGIDGADLDRGDSVEIETWFQNEGKVEIRRDWIIREDSPSRRVIARATRYFDNNCLFEVQRV
jgi:hypothetical protein